MRTELTPSSAVPVSEIAQDAISGVLATPCAFHVIVVPLSVPLAVPATFSPPAHVALNAPVAEVGDCCVGVQLKSVQLEAGGMMPVDADFHVPTSASNQEPVGLVGVVVLLSYPTHAADEANATASA